jgi:hypothetical protein
LGFPSRSASPSSVWLGTLAAYLVASLPPSSAIVGVAVAIYLASTVAAAARRRPTP